MSEARVPVRSRPTRTKPEPVARERILKDDTLEAVAEYINAGKAAGIKDFRSPGTGLYDDLERFNLPYPEAIFDIAFFKNNPSPFFRLAKELLPGRYRPTLTHYLLPLLAKKGLLLRSYTQNIDMLERLTGLDEELLVEAHGSFASSSCIECMAEAESKWVRSKFGSHDLNDFKKCDLLIVLGTSLQVEPFNRLITKVPGKCPRVLINRDRAGEDIYGGFDFDDKLKYSVQRDALFLGSCDDGVRKLAKLCGWEGALQAMFEAGNIEMQLAEEMEALELAKELEEEKKKLDEAADENIGVNNDDKDEALIEITKLLGATKLSSDSTTETVVIVQEVQFSSTIVAADTESQQKPKPKDKKSAPGTDDKDK
ncbi:NAD-dependent protein deacetylase sirtuin-2 [Mortierella polycephala]|uniref:NAD-dependent protein deacetylase sirtuin-2 n=1 Tax=Mortierella polycephala TaxID=41804 RepID=A0A9P6PNL3_9FUNG|nr:NAD-dependent protein deacetylase sirtuin-2 [Mortierella polycephala]